MQEGAISEFKAKCRALLEQVRKTRKPIRVTRFGKSVADVIPPSPVQGPADWLGSMSGTVEILGDIVPRDRGRRLGGAARLKLLLDTHIWLQSLAEPRRLARRVQKELKDRSNELWLSPVNTWEALLLNSKGKIRLRGDLAVWLARATAHMREAPYRPRPASARSSVEHPRKGRSGSRAWEKRRSNPPRRGV